MTNNNSTIRMYSIDGHSYRFIRVHSEAGIFRGYCPRVRKYAWLNDNYIQFDGEPVVLATMKKD